MNKVSSFLILILICSSIFLNVTAVHATENTLIITPDIGVNLRAEPNKEATIVNKLKQGYRVEKIDETGEWIKVSFKDSIGYIMKEYTKPLHHDLVSTYAFYAQLLQEYQFNNTYSLLYDFNQDGQEDLYLVIPQQDTELTYIHKLYNGKELVFEENLQEGLDIYWDDYNYYIVTSLAMNRGGIQYTPQELGIDFSADTFDANISINSGNVIRPGNLKFLSVPYSEEWVEVIGYYNNDEWFEYPSQEMNFYSYNKKTISEKEFNSILNFGPNHLNLFTDILGAIEQNPEYSSNFEETKIQLTNLIAKYNSAKDLPFTEDEISKINTYLWTSFSKVNPQNINYLDLLKDFELNLLLNGTIYGREYYEEEYIELERVFNEETSMNPVSKISKDKVNQWIYETYGIRVNEQILQSQLDETNKIEQTLFSIMDDYYTCLCDGMGDNLSPRPIIKNIHHLDNEYIALEYNEYEPFTEFYIESMASGHGYLIVKKVEFSADEIYYPYIQHTNSIENLNYSTLDNYSSQLDVVKDFEALKEAEIQKTAASSNTNDNLTETTIRESKITPILWGSLIIVIAIFILAIYLFSKKKSQNKMTSTNSD